MDSNPSAIASSEPSPEYTELTPNFRLPLGLVVLGAALFWLQPWVGGAIALLGLFLIVQTVMLRLRFSATALEIYRGTQQIRQFPYSDWLNWEIFWQPVPILFYFKEVNSIHFLPIIFSPQQLRTSLEQHCPRPETAPEQPS
ncbi:MAG TPA: DUF3119 family protein [Trichocoleus sp.]